MKIPAAIVVAVWLALPARAGATSVVDSKHNLSVFGPGPYTAVSEEEVCIFCHTPHDALQSYPLWNREASQATYMVYSSPSTVAAIGQPAGTSRLCLSCHDGTVALGAVGNPAGGIEFPQGHDYLPEGAGGLGTVLANDHPVSFVYDGWLATTRGELVDPGALPPDVPLFGDQLECTTCHDAHDDARGQFLRRSNVESSLCTTCHQQAHWSGASHQTSTAGWNGQAPDPWPESPGGTVRAHACGSCHLPHNAGGQYSLLRHGEEQDNCVACHNGHVAQHDIEAEMAKSNQHSGSAQAGLHEVGEDPFNMPRHVECVDCHDPHAARASGAGPAGPLEGVSGMTIGGSVVAEIGAEYELCLKCHGVDVPGAAPSIPRQVDELNARREFESAALSYHPVAFPGRNPDVPTLLPPWTTSSTMACTECHANDDLSANPGAPRGPHGSRNPWLLRAHYATDFTPESPAAYALCYRCHDRSKLLDKHATAFSEHKKHIEGEDAPCSACHDPHGIPAGGAGGNSGTHLINFDLSIVAPNRDGLLRFEDLGDRTGRCYLSCHGEDHHPEQYPD